LRLRHYERKLFEYRKRRNELMENNAEDGWVALSLYFSWEKVGAVTRL